MLISESEVKFNALDIPRSEKDSQDDFEKIEKQIEMNEEELKNSVEQVDNLYNIKTLNDHKDQDDMLALK